MDILYCPDESEAQRVENACSRASTQWIANQLPVTEIHAISTTCSFLPMFNNQTPKYK